MAGGVSTLATDEYPTSLALKLRGRTIEDVTGGNVGAEARIGIAFTEGSSSADMSLERFAAVTATNAARIFGLHPRKGVIAPGSDADLVLIDPAIRKTLTRDDFHVSDYSPWEGWAVSGWPVTTLLRGKVIADRGQVLGEVGDGLLVPRRIDPAVLRPPRLLIWRGRLRPVLPVGGCPPATAGSRPAARGAGRGRGIH